MKVLLIANNFPPAIGGSAVVYHKLCQHLGDEVTVIAPRRRYQDGSELPLWRETDEKQPFGLHRVELLHPLCPHSAASGLRSAWRFVTQDLSLRRKVLKFVLQMIDCQRPDVVCLGELYALAWLGTALRRLRNLPVVHYVHGEELTIGAGSRMYARAAAKALRNAEAFVAVSSFTRRLLLDRGVQPARVHTILNGVDCRQFSPGPKDNRMLSRYGLGTGKVLLTVARLEERKGHDVVLRALPAIRQAVPDTKYLIVGEGARLPKLKAIARELGLEDCVIFAGAVPNEELAAHYRSCDLFVMPNRTLPNGDTEGFGLVFLEAGACGKAVVGGRDGGVPDAVVHGQNGLLVDGTSEAEVAAAVCRLLNEESLAQRMGISGMEFARRASWEQKTVEFRAVCQAALGLREPRASASGTKAGDLPVFGA